MSKPAKRTNGKYIEAGYEDKIVFKAKKKGRHPANVLATWRKSQGLWTDHPVFKDMTVKGIVEWFRGEDCSTA